MILHSYIPPNGVVGNLEQNFKTHSVVEIPEKNLEICLGTNECKVFDWKRT